jgi:hypothetical protein
MLMKMTDNQYAKYSNKDFFFFLNQNSTDMEFFIDGIGTLFMLFSNE